MRSKLMLTLLFSTFLSVQVMASEIPVPDTMKGIAKSEDSVALKEDSTEKEIVDFIVNDKTNHVLGNPEGSFVIIEFFDYQCGWCKKTNQEISKVLADASNIRWILMDTPIFGEKSETIAAYVIAAAQQGKFKEMHEAVSNAAGGFDEARLIELAQTLNLDIQKLQADAKSQAVKDKLSANKKLANKLGLAGVPMLIVDGEVHVGALIGEKLEAAVAASKVR